eukprot:gnl/TRDRNA2_/TRDRNA2_87437_c0_seq1.p1 gnl/TRDRNA2_/TRDRNA2_87437_c0~~gnl/TRDRNA2_/TRDRNA2_87437_c0_seq1.p1  ORF type:complete len:238 (+),score=36.23 gnl/TRDRNA2_/TRDRNA2_87437_c0_seq1:115-828(+)
MTVIVAYWKIRGLGAPLRMLCEYAGADYTAATYEVTGSPGHWDLTSWFNLKPPLQAKNALMNLPHVVDGEVTITQTVVCLSYLGRKYGLMGRTDEEALKVLQIICEAQDLRNKAVRLFYSSPSLFDTQKGPHLADDVPASYKKFEAWLMQEGTIYTVGDTPTAGDFHLWEMIDQHELFAKDLGRPSPVQQFPKLLALYNALKAEKKLEKYFAGPLYALPVNNPYAAWGAQAPQRPKL